MRPTPSQVIVYEDARWPRLLPLVYLRGVFQLLCGMDDLLAKVRRLLDREDPRPSLAIWCREHLAEVLADQTALPANQPASEGTLLLNGRGLWRDLPESSIRGRSWVGTAEDQVACVWVDAKLAETLDPGTMLDEMLLAGPLGNLPRQDVGDFVRLLDWPWEIVLANHDALRADWGSHYRHQADIYPSLRPGVDVLDIANVHLGPDTRVKPGAVIDAEEGPVWVGAGVTISPHVSIQGPAYVADGTVLPPGAAIRPGTTIGPRCKVGGEIEDSIIQGFTNKQHDGFLGHSYVGSWVNLGADCLNSDLKNTYGTVRVPINGVEIETGEQFVGMFVGDYAKAGINVGFPTGAVVGFCSSIVAGLSPKFVPSFTWVEGVDAFPLDENHGLAFARRMMARRQQVMTPAQERAFRQVRSQAAEIETPADLATVPIAARLVR